jgi:glutathione S-transferase
MTGSAPVASPFKLLLEDDPVYAWRERLVDAFDGLVRKSQIYHR